MRQRNPHEHQPADGIEFETASHRCSLLDTGLAPTVSPFQSLSLSSVAD